jgi:hypothetical protein
MCIGKDGNVAGVEESDKWFEIFVNPGIVKVAAIKLAKYGIVDQGSLGCKMYITEHGE